MIIKNKVLLKFTKSKRIKIKIIVKEDKTKDIIGVIKLLT